MESPIFALLGAAGFVAPRHIEAIYSVDGELAAHAISQIVLVCWTVDFLIANFSL